MNENFRIQTLFLGVDSLPYFLSTNFLQRKMLFLFQDAYINVEGKKKKKKEPTGKRLYFKMLSNTSSCSDAFICICFRITGLQ